MNKQLKFEYNGKEYCLEYTRKTVAEMEKNGFIAEDIKSKPMLMLPELFAGAFLANHRFVKRDVIDEIYGKLTNKAELIGKLVEMYTEPIQSLIDEPSEDEGNLSWTISW